jgi:hypothetical protein
MFGNFHLRAVCHVTLEPNIEAAAATPNMYSTTTTILIVLLATMYLPMIWRRGKEGDRELLFINPNHASICYLTLQTLAFHLFELKVQVLWARGAVCLS